AWRPPPFPAGGDPAPAAPPPTAPPPVAAQARAEAASPRGDDAEAAPPPALSGFEPVLLDRLPVGVLLHQHDTLLYATRRFLEWTGHENLATLAAAGGLDALFADPGA